jgi:hypothetical protein
VYADGMIGRWKRGPDGYNKPNVRNLVKPLLGMFSGEPRGKKWRTAVSMRTSVFGVRMWGMCWGRQPGAELPKHFIFKCAQGESQFMHGCGPGCKACNSLPAPTELCALGWVYLQVDEQLKTATTVSEVLNNTYHILLPETLDAPPKPTVPTQVALPHLAAELPCN